MKSLKSLKNIKSVKSLSIALERPLYSEKVDMPFVLLVLIFCGLGFITLYSGSYAYGARVFDDPFYFVKRQAINFVMGIAAMALFALVDLSLVRRLLPKIVIFTIILNILPFVPGIGITKNGAARWIGIGPMTFQPSELVKIVSVIFLANLFEKKSDRLDEPSVSIYPAAFMCAVFIFLVYLQRNLSTALFVFLIAATMFFIANVGISWFVRFFLIVFPFFVLMILTEEYRIERILSFLQPEKDPPGASYQVNAAITALSEGGFWGRGLGNGVRKISSIPEVQSDFIFAVWGEEMGFVGVLFYFCLLVIFTLKAASISLKAASRFECFLGLGCTFIIFFQSIMNCGVIVRFFPSTGVPLPFFSSGGSSLLVTLSICGFILNVSRKKESEV